MQLLYERWEIEIGSHPPFINSRIQHGARSFSLHTPNSRRIYIVVVQSELFVGLHLLAGQTHRPDFFGQLHAAFVKKRIAPSHSCLNKEWRVKRPVGFQRLREREEEECRFYAGSVYFGRCGVWTWIHHQCGKESPLTWPKTNKCGMGCLGRLSQEMKGWWE